jgi:N-acetylmuramoyl-L-alanine amidase
VCHHCLGSTDALQPHTPIERRRFLQLAAAGAAGAVVAATPSIAHAAGKIPAPKITPRSTWGADESIRGPRVIGWAPFRKIVIHHTASPNRVKDIRRTMQIGYRLHVVQRGYSDIGYHFMISPDGEILEGRRARTYAPGEVHSGEDGAKNGVIGGHSFGKNAGTVGICLIGNFMEAKPTDAALSSLAHLVSWEAQRHQIDPLGSDPYIDLEGTRHEFFNIVGHRGIRQTLCPGAFMVQQMPWLRQEVAERVGRFPARTSDMRRLAWVL